MWTLCLAPFFEIHMVSFRVQYVCFTERHDMWQKRNFLENFTTLYIMLKVREILSWYPSKTTYLHRSIGSKCSTFSCWLEFENHLISRLLIQNFCPGTVVKRSSLIKIQQLLPRAENLQWGHDSRTYLRIGWGDAKEKLCRISCTKGTTRNPYSTGKGIFCSQTNSEPRISWSNVWHN